MDTNSMEELTTEQAKLVEEILFRENRQRKVDELIENVRNSVPDYSNS